VQLFSTRPAAERRVILAYPFEELWNNLWGGCKLSKSLNDVDPPRGDPPPPSGKGESADRTSIKYGNRKEYNDSRRKFGILNNGIHMRTEDGVIISLDMPYVIRLGRKYDSEQIVPEWGFPKGRRNMSKESGLECALRELREETGIKQNIAEVLKVKPFEEVFTGSNGVRYKHIYYVARIGANQAEPPIIKPCRRELRAAGFMTKDTIVSLFNGSKERQELFKRLIRVGGTEELYQIESRTTNLEERRLD
jgi:ADP-ribose pyrophosphatase YjhB (NUDIX family)